jgi:uncharacterized protein (TIGR03435 family)
MLSPLIGLWLLSVPFVSAQAHFAVASIKPNQSGNPRLENYAYTPVGRFTATNATLVDMIVSAYGIRRIQMSGGPDWIDSERFDVIAKSEAGEANAEMVRSLLEDRFKLKLHTESRDMAVLALVVGRAPVKVEAPKPDQPTAFLHPKLGQIVFQNMPIDGLVNYMSNMLHTPVVDRTGLKGSFDFAVDTTLVSVGGPESFGDLLVAAVREQLGFRMEKQKAALTITIVDRAERPSQN